MAKSTIIEWVATAVTLLGALSIALHKDAYTLYLMNVGSFLWLIWATIEGRRSIQLVNLGMLSIYLFGLFNPA